MNSNNEDLAQSWWQDIGLDAADDVPNIHNPPPENLPDLLDELILSEEALVAKIELCDKLAHDLIPRTKFVKNKLEVLRSKHPEWLSKPNLNGEYDETEEDKVQVALRQQVMFLSRVLIQLQFLHFLLSQKWRDSAVTSVEQHRRLLDAFLGERRAHPGIEVANARLQHCVEGCPFYYLNGSHEWTKKPYSQGWVDDMTSSDWSWPTVQREIEGLVRSGRAEISPTIDLLYAHLKRMLPYWFWSNNPQPWSLIARVSNKMGADDGIFQKVHTLVRCKKPPGMIEKERVARLAQMQQEQAAKGEPEESAVDAAIVIDPEAVHEVDPGAGLDGKALIRDWNDGAKEKQLRSWLDYWGFQDWIKQYRSRM